MKWKYKIEPTKAAYDEKRLNELGNDGWELVAVTEYDVLPEAGAHRHW